MGFSRSLMALLTSQTNQEHFQRLCIQEDATDTLVTLEESELFLCSEKITLTLEAANKMEILPRELLAQTTTSQRSSEELITFFEQSDNPMS